MVAKSENWLIRAMCEPSFYDHPVANVALIETHISWVFLAGEFAYKVKKPVNFGFLNFSTLAKRHHFCLEELRLNQNFSPQIYLEVKQIGGTPDTVALNKEPVLEYAVKMRRFPREQQLDAMLTGKTLQAHHLAGFAVRIAEIHSRAIPATAQQFYGEPTAIISPALENFSQISPYATNRTSKGQLAHLEQWTLDTFDNLKPDLLKRKADGFIRECHGDIHLANMAWFEKQPVLFDCIEFNENLRWIDVINDIAFLVMDLDDRGEAALGWHFLNHYLQETGDYQGLTLLNFYKVYRAIVRAKVNSLRLTQAGLSKFEQDRDTRLFHDYLDLASTYTQQKPQILMITHGLSGSGKTSFASKLSDACGAILLQSDRERKRLHELSATADTQSPVGEGIYTLRDNAATYQTLFRHADTSLASGYSVLVDATFLKQQDRDRFRQLSEQRQVQLMIFDFPVETEELRHRIRCRREQKNSVSEADLKVLDHQLEHADPLTKSERRDVMLIQAETSAAAVAKDLLR